MSAQALAEYLALRGHHDSAARVLDAAGADAARSAPTWLAMSCSGPAGGPALRTSAPHRLRHALATEMLARGASLADISQVLRHRDLATTAIYAKVDFGRLRQVAQPWPGATR